MPVGDAAGAMLAENLHLDAAGVTVIWANGGSVRLEPRDVIYNLDSLPIRAAVDVMKDYRQTSVSFLDGRTGRAFAGKMVLPPPIRVLIALRRAGGAWASVCGGLV